MKFKKNDSVRVVCGILKDSIGTVERVSKISGSVTIRISRSPNSAYQAGQGVVLYPYELEKWNATLPGRAFTLIELLVCILIVCLLMSIVLPVLSHGIHAARDARCDANVRSIVQAHAAYRADNKWRFPPSLDAIGCADLFCPSDPDRTTYMMLIPFGQSSANISDTFNPSKVLVSQDWLPIHPWHNASYLDGHAHRR